MSEFKETVNMHDKFEDEFYERFMDETLLEMGRCKVGQNAQAIAHAIMIAGAFIANAIEDSSEKQVLNQQIKTLREAIKYGRNFYKCRYEMTMRQFAESLGTTAKQLSEWTESEISTEPDFKD